MLYFSTCKLSSQKPTKIEKTKEKNSAYLIGGSKFFHRLLFQQRLDQTNDYIRTNEVCLNTKIKIKNNLSQLDNTVHTEIYTLILDIASEHFLVGLTWHSCIFQFKLNLFPERNVYHN